ncbi:drug resistance transporter, EmrB/QacA subfamily [Lentzea fradiae]|uniref:Drug resistance transporter, EmrB/QacA subfamily n=1 Tax=Lentzea fradiae TaxID=200378 RepID=A0A1G7M7N1_9PSEU|nr:MDR family MFS transporter [Lentzea fradiae]SDF57743.1 drug resistance transporter, EmrB/QacA subfamily [Lentzea fradiae]
MTRPSSHREILEALSGIWVALLVAILSSTIVSNALPTILAELNGTQTQYTWVITSMLLASTASTPVWGKLADLFDKKTLLQTAIVLFVIGSVLSGFSQNMEQLIGFRVVQGLGMGGVQALGQVVVGALLSPRERGRYSGYTGMVISAGTVGGPLVGGFLVDWPGWRWCFFVCVPLALVALVVLRRTLHLPTVRQHVKIDYLGATLITGGVSLLLMWVSFAGKDFAWVSGESALFAGGALLVLAAAYFVERRASAPVIPLHLFRNRTVVLAMFGGVAVGTAMFGASVFMGQYFQIARGFSPTKAGLLTVPLVLGLSISSTISGQLISRSGRWKSYLVWGAFSLVAGLALLGTIDHRTNLVLMGAYLALVGVGVGLTMQNLVLAVQNGVGMADLGAASSTATFLRSLGGTAGVSVLGAVLAAQVSTQTLGRGSLSPVVRDSYGDAMGQLFLIAAGLAVFTVVAVLFIKEQPLRESVDVTPTGSGEQSVATELASPVDTDQRVVDNSRPAVDKLLVLSSDGGQEVVARSVALRSTQNSLPSGSRIVTQPVPSGLR